MDAGVPGNKTSHSLNVTGASALFQAGMPEKVIQEHTGHMERTQYQNKLKGLSTIFTLVSLYGDENSAHEKE